MKYKIQNFNYLLINGCLVLKFLDVFITDLVLRSGGIELNPLGFNAFTIIMGFVIIIPLYFMNYYFRDRYSLSMISIIAIVIIIMLGFVISKGVNLL